MRVGRPLLLSAALLSAMLLGERSAIGQPVAFRQFLSPNLGEEKPHVTFDSESTFPEDVAGQDASFQMTGFDLRMTLPVHQTSAQEWTLLSRVGARNIESQAVLPDTFEDFPSSLWDLRMGIAHRRRLANDWIAGGNVEIGSASDLPFASLEEIRVNANFFARIPAANKRDAWLLLLNYSNVRDFARNIPIPGVAYQFERGRTLRGLVGVPIIDLAYRPAERLNLELSYFIPRFVRARAGFKLFDEIELYGLFGWNNQSYLRHDRRDADDQLVYYEKRAAAGLLWQANEQLAVDFSIGYAFDRYFYEGEDYGDRGDNRLDIGDGPVAQLRVNVTF